MRQIPWLRRAVAIRVDKIPDMSLWALLNHSSFSTFKHSTQTQLELIKDDALPLSCVKLTYFCSWKSRVALWVIQNIFRASHGYKAPHWHIKFHYCHQNLRPGLGWCSLCQNILSHCSNACGCFSPRKIQFVHEALPFSFHDLFVGWASSNLDYTTLLPVGRAFFQQAFHVTGSLLPPAPRLTFSWAFCGVEWVSKVN